MATDHLSVLINAIFTGGVPTVTLIADQGEYVVYSVESNTLTGNKAVMATCSQWLASRVRDHDAWAGLIKHVTLKVAQSPAFNRLQATDPIKFHEMLLTSAALAFITGSESEARIAGLVSSVRPIYDNHKAARQWQLHVSTLWDKVVMVGGVLAVSLSAGAVYRVGGTASGSKRFGSVVACTAGVAGIWLLWNRLVRGTRADRFAYPQNVDFGSPLTAPPSFAPAPTPPVMAGAAAPPTAPAGPGIPPVATGASGPPPAPPPLIHTCKALRGRRASSSGGTTRSSVDSRRSSSSSGDDSTPPNRGKGRGRQQGAKSRGTKGGTASGAGRGNSRHQALPPPGSVCSGHSAVAVVAAQQRLLDQFAGTRPSRQTAPVVRPSAPPLDGLEPGSAAHLAAVNATLPPNARPIKAQPVVSGRAEPTDRRVPRPSPPTSGSVPVVPQSRAPPPSSQVPTPASAPQSGAGAGSSADPPPTAGIPPSDDMPDLSQWAPRVRSLNVKARARLPAGNPPKPDPEADGVEEEKGDEELGDDPTAPPAPPAPATPEYDSADDETYVPSSPPFTVSPPPARFTEFELASARAYYAREARTLGCPDLDHLDAPTLSVLRSLKPPTDLAGNTIPVELRVGSTFVFVAPVAARPVPVYAPLRVSLLPGPNSNRSLYDILIATDGGRFGLGNLVTAVDAYPFDDTVLYSPWEYYRGLDYVQLDFPVPAAPLPAVYAMPRPPKTPMPELSVTQMESLAAMVGILGEEHVQHSLATPGSRTHPTGERCWTFKGVRSKLDPAPPTPGMVAAGYSIEPAKNRKPHESAPCVLIGTAIMGMLPAVFEKGPHNEAVALTHRHMAEPNTNVEILAWKSLVYPMSVAHAGLGGRLSLQRNGISVEYTDADIPTFEGLVKVMADAPFWRLLAQIKPYHEPVSLATWLDTQTAKKAEVYVKALDGMDVVHFMGVNKTGELRPGQKSYHTRSSFLKRELILPTTETLPGYNGENLGVAAKAPRLIQGMQNPVMNCALGPFCYALSAAWAKSVCDDWLPQFLFACGRTSEEIGRWFSQLSDLYVDGITLECDYSRFDSTVLAGPTFLEHMFYVFFHPDSAAQWALREQMMTTGFTPNLMYRLPFSRKSGDQNTTIGNSLINAIATAAALEAAGADPLDYHILVMGDDNLVFIKTPGFVSRLGKVTTYLKGLGLRPKLSAPEFPCFCSREFAPFSVQVVEPGAAPGEGQWALQYILAPKITRFMVKFGWALDELAPTDSLVGRLAANIESDPLLSIVPVIRVVAAYYRQRGEERNAATQWRAFLPSRLPVALHRATLDWYLEVYGISQTELGVLESDLLSHLTNSDGQASFWSHPIFERMVRVRGL